MDELHYSIKDALGYKRTSEDKEIIADWKKRTSRLCKPCWELKHCPYGPLVEQFPLLPIVLKDAEAHNEYLMHCLANGALSDGRKLDAKRRRFFQKALDSFKAGEHPTKIPQVLKDYFLQSLWTRMSCLLCRRTTN